MGTGQVWLGYKRPSFDGYLLHQNGHHWNNSYIPTLQEKTTSVSPKMRTFLLILAVALAISAVVVTGRKLKTRIQV